MKASLRPLKNRSCCPLFPSDDVVSKRKMLSRAGPLVVPPDCVREAKALGEM